MAYWKTVLFDFDQPLLEAPDDLEREFHTWREMLQPDLALCHVLATIVSFMKMWKAFLPYGEAPFLAWCVWRWYGQVAFRGGILRLLGLAVVHVIIFGLSLWGLVSYLWPLPEKVERAKASADAMGFQRRLNKYLSGRISASRAMVTWVFLLKDLWRVIRFVCFKGARCRLLLGK
jgi:hypothetical protein